MPSVLTPLENEKNLIKRIRNKFHREFIQIPQRSRLRKRFINTLPLYSTYPSNKYSIHSLLCHRDVEMGICCFKAFNYFAGDNFEFIIHDDGSLTDSDIQYIRNQVVAKIHTKSESDEIAFQTLQLFPNILKYRNSHFLALKLIDVILLGSGTRMAYLDSDILFFQKPEFYLETFMTQEKSKNYFNKDFFDAYIDSPENIQKNLGVFPFPFINAGLWVCNKEDLDLHKIEEWLATEYLKPFINFYRLEQTLLSLLARESAHGADYLPEGYNVDLLKLPQNCIGKHYVGKIRHGFELEGIRYLLQAGHIVPDIGKHI